MVTNCLKTLSVNGVCVLDANSMAGRKLATSNLFSIVQYVPEFL
jgi:hypothetical protein